MFRTITRLVKDLFSKTEIITLHDARLGKLTCEFTSEENYFFWSTEINTLNKDGKETSVSIEGSRSSPDKKSVERVHWAIDSVEMIIDIAQQETTRAFPDKGFNIRRDFGVSDISTFMLDESEASDVEIEFESDKHGLLTVEFEDGKFVAVTYTE